MLRDIIETGAYRGEDWLWWPILGPLAYARDLGWSLREAWYREVPPPLSDVPTIAVGNFTVGGTGKTPVVRELARHALAHRQMPAILTRGYGARRGIEGHVPDDARAAVWGDEPVLLTREGLRVYVGADRAHSAKLARDDGADVLLLDDGLQQRSLRAHRSIALVDARWAVERAPRLPAGPWRERASGLARCEVAIAVDLPRELAEAVWARVHREAPLVQCVSARRRLDGFRTIAGHACDDDPRDLGAALLVTGVAQPERVRRSAESWNVVVAEHLQFNDHAPFDEAAIARMRASLEATGAAWLVTTEKDAVRWPEPLDLGVPVRAMATRLEFDPPLDQWAAPEK